MSKNEKGMITGFYLIRLKGKNEELNKDEEPVWLTFLPKEPNSPLGVLYPSKITAIMVPDNCTEVQYESFKKLSENYGGEIIHVKISSETIISGIFGTDIRKQNENYNKRKGSEEDFIIKKYNEEGKNKDFNFSEAEKNIFSMNGEDKEEGEYENDDYDEEVESIFKENEEEGEYGDDYGGEETELISDQPLPPFIKKVNISDKNSLKKFIKFLIMLYKKQFGKEDLD